jgi:mRNA-degrading endonuclease RelE of RelBE toxin-antitoxin system
MKKFEQVLILEAIEIQLAKEPQEPTKNKKPLRPNDLSKWELRVDRYRVFYDVDKDNQTVKVKAIGWKEHDRLYIRGKGFRL